MHLRVVSETQFQVLNESSRAISKTDLKVNKDFLEKKLNIKVSKMSEDEINDRLANMTGMEEIKYMNYLRSLNTIINFH